MRSIWIHRILHSAVRRFVRIYRFFHKLAHPRLGVIRHYLDQKEEAMQIAGTHLNEISRVMQQQHWYVRSNVQEEPEELIQSFKTRFGWRPHWEIPDRLIAHKEQLRLAKLMLSQKASIRSLYLKNSIMMVSSPDKCFRLSRQQFDKLMRDTLFNKDHSAKVIDEIWNDAKLPLITKVNIKTEGGKKSIVGRGVKKAKKPGPEDLELNLSQFVDACLRLTNATDSLMVEGASISDCFKAAIEERFVPSLEGFTLDPFTVENGQPLNEIKALPEVDAVFVSLNARLRKFYKKYGGSNKAGDDDLDIIEYMLALNQAKCIDATLTNARALEIFVRCNQQEVEEYLNDMPDFQKILDMSADWDEFIDCLIMCADCQKKRKKDDGIEVRLQAFIERMLSNVQM